METNFIKRVCDSPLCDTVETYNPQKPDLDAMSKWVFIATHAVKDVPPNPQNPQGGGRQIVQTVLQYCREACAVNSFNYAPPNPQCAQNVLNLTGSPDPAKRPPPAPPNEKMKKGAC